MSNADSERVGRIRKWSREEKQRLLELTQKYTHNNRVMWHEVIKSMPHRSINQCKTKFMLELNQHQNQVTNKWTHAEFEQLVELVARHGRKWSELQQKYFPNRDSDSLRIKYMTNLRRHEGCAGGLAFCHTGSLGPSLQQILSASSDKPDSLPEEPQPPSSASADLVKELLALLQ